MAFARVRLFAVQITTATTNEPFKIYSGASNGVTWLPPVANYNTVFTDGGLFLLLDPNSATSTNGMYVTSGHCNVVLDSGSNTVAGNVLIIGGSVT